ncbi:MAB_1171c family putative transporter [Streptomyces sp. NPDC004647]|uniref:MAB_1171c family putative transporter n=1 Tax=Streptomyces sp. NPDC004647 TaxID=3154671 RepID=UPI0033BD71DB
MALNIVFAGSTLIYLAVFLYKFNHLRANWDNARLWTMCIGCLFFLIPRAVGGPTSQHFINEVTGVPNIAILLMCIAHSGASAAFVSLALFWRYPTQVAWPRVRWIIAACALNVVILVTLFAMLDVPEERVSQNFASHYIPKQPLLFVFYLFYSVPTLTGFSMLSFWCLAWARTEDYASLPRLRRALSLYGWSSVFKCVFQAGQLGIFIAIKFSAYPLENVMQIFVIVAGPLFVPMLAAALLVPWWGPRWEAFRDWTKRWQAFLALRSLHHALQPVGPASVIVAQDKKLDPHHRVRRMVIELNDWCLALSPLFNPTTQEQVESHGRKVGLTGTELAALIEAVQLHTAKLAWQQGTRPPSNGTEHQHDEEVRDGTGIDEEIIWWIQVARAYKTTAAFSETVSYFGD